MVAMLSAGRPFALVLAVGACALVLAAPGEGRPTHEVSCSTTQASSPNLSGEWSASDGGTYWISQIGTCLWWVGFSGPLDSSTMGKSFSNVLFATVKGSSIEGLWADVPRGGILGYGTLKLAAKGTSLLYKRSQTGSGFGGRLWKRKTKPGAARIAKFPASVECSLLPTDGPVDRTGKPVSLTGIWKGPLGGIYWVRQIGSCVWWAGFSGALDSSTMGKSFSTAFYGETSTPSAGINKISGSWADVPRARNVDSGSLYVSISLGSTLRLISRTTTGRFKKPAVWTKLP